MSAPDVAAEPTLLVEDDVAVREALARALATAPDFALAASVGSAAEALAVPGPLRLAVVDLGLPDMQGADLIRLLKECHPGLDVMVLTVHEDRDAVFEAILAGASSYLLKGVTTEQWLAWLRELRDGGSPMSPRIAREVLAAFRAQRQVAARYELTHREREVLHHLEEGLSYKEVGAKLHLSAHTVHTHIKNIYEKLHASSKREALAKARVRGIL